MIEEQRKDPEILQLLHSGSSVDGVGDTPSCFYRESCILMRRWRHPDIPVDVRSNTVNLIVVSRRYRAKIVILAHNHRLSAHLEIKRMLDHIRRHFNWPKMRQDVVRYCKACHICQTVGKPNQAIPRAPLQPVLISREPCSRVSIDRVGALPKYEVGNRVNNEQRLLLQTPCCRRVDP